MDFEVEQMSMCQNVFAIRPLPDLYRAEHYALRCAWAVLLSTAMVGAVWGCYRILVDYSQKPVVVTYFVQVSVRRNGVVNEC